LIFQSQLERGCPSLAVILSDPDPEPVEGDGESKDLRFVFFARKRNHNSSGIDYSAGRAASTVRPAAAEAPEQRLIGKV
jgi:hypothetical protein